MLFALGTISSFRVSLRPRGRRILGPFWGTALNLGGATLGAAAAFLIARYVAADWVRQKAAGRLDRLITGVEAEGWRFVAFVRLVPLFPFNLTNYALGVTRISLKHYILASLVCMVPGTAYLARPCRPRGHRRRHVGDSLQPDRARAAGRNRALPRLVRRCAAEQPQWIE